MRLWVQACGAAIMIGIAMAAGCGGSVIVDGSGGDGGSGGDSATSSSSFTSAVTTGPTTSSVTSSVTTGPSPTSVTTSVSTGPTSVCDNTGNCGDGETGCIGCSLAEDGPCWPAYEACISSDECITYSDCVNNCPPDDPTCYQKCAEIYALGAQQYNELVSCVICGACYNDCDGQASGCP